MKLGPLQSQYEEAVKKLDESLLEAERQLQALNMPILVEVPLRDNMRLSFAKLGTDTAFKLLVTNDKGAAPLINAGVPFRLAAARALPKLKKALLLMHEELMAEFPGALKELQTFNEAGPR